MQSSPPRGCAGMAPPGRSEQPKPPAIPLLYGSPGMPLLPQHMLTVHPEAPKEQIPPQPHLIPVQMMRRQPGAMPPNEHSLPESPRPVADRQQCSEMSMCVPPAQCLPLHTSHTVFVSHVEDGPLSFFLQPESAVEELLPKLQEIDWSYAVASPISGILIPGAYVVVKGRDDALCRAVVIKTNPETCNVHLIDYGNNEDHPYSDIFPMPKTAAELSPAMAMQFFLANMKKVEITSYGKKYFSHLVLGKKVSIRVAENEIPLGLQSCEVFCDGRNMRDVLFGMNHPAQYHYHPTRHVPDTECVLVAVTCVNGPTDFYVHLPSEIDTLLKIQNTVGTFCRGLPRLEDISAINLGSPVAAYYSENSTWYRALVIGASRNKIKVFIVDFGNSIEVNVNELCLIPHDLVTTWKTHAIRCCLTGFNAISPPPLYLTEKMLDIVVSRIFKLKQCTLPCGLRFDADLIDSQGNSVSQTLQALLNEGHNPQPLQANTQRVKKGDLGSSEGGTRGQRPETLGQSSRPAKTQRVQHTTPVENTELPSNQHNVRPSQRSRRCTAIYIPPPARLEGKVSKDIDERGNKIDQHSGQDNLERKHNKFWQQHDDRCEKTVKPITDLRMVRKRGLRRAYMDIEPEWDVRKSDQFGDKDDQNEFGNRFADLRLVDRENQFGNKGNQFDDTEHKFGDHDQNPKRNSGVGSKPQKTAVAKEGRGDVPVAEYRRIITMSDYIHQPIVIGQEYKVFFTEMNAPNDIYVQFADCEPVLDKIRKLIDADTNAPSRLVALLAMPVLARFDADGLLYRALIKSLAHSEKGQVDVLFVDYGNSSVVSLSEVFPISAELLEIPTQAFRVIITDMPSFPRADLNAWQSHFMEERLTLKPSSIMTVNLVQRVRGTLLLPGGKSVAKEIESDHLCSGVQPSAQANVPVVGPSTGEEQKTTPTEPTSVAWVERLDLLVGQTMSAKVLEKLETDLYSLQVSACSGLMIRAQSEDPLSSDLTAGEQVIVNVKALLRDRLMVIVFYEKGSSLSGSNAISPVCPLPIIKRKGVFIVSRKEQEFIYLHQDVSGTVLDELLYQMFEFYEAQGEVPEDEFKSGDICAAQSNFNGKWYRARIESVNDTYTVRYIDYGGAEEVAFEKTKMLSTKFMGPELCVRVALPVKYLNIEGCFGSLNEDLLECTFIKKDMENNYWIVDLSAVGNEESLALSWITEKKAEGISSIPADPRLRDPGWNLKKGDSIPIYITHVESVDMFWVQLGSCLAAIEALQKKLEELPEGDATELEDIFVAKFATDGQWYRAMRCGNGIRFIDYGNTDPGHERKKLPEDLIHPTKGYAIPCRLCVEPAGAEWTEAANQAFDEFMEGKGCSPDDFMEAQIVSVDFETIVDINFGNDLLSSFLIFGGHAVPFESRVEDRRDKLVEQMFPVGIAKPVEHFVANIVEDEIPKYQVLGVVPWAMSMNDFYIQLDSKSDAIDMLAKHLSGADDFDVVEDPSIGEYIVAKFPEDLAWYRAKVVSKEPLRVQFVDYGNVSPSTEFRKLPSDLAILPLLAWHCSAETDDAAVNKKFIYLVDEEIPFEVEFIGIKEDRKHIVKLFVDGESVETIEPSLIC